MTTHLTAAAIAFTLGWLFGRHSRQRKADDWEKETYRAGFVHGRSYYREEVVWN